MIAGFFVARRLTSPAKKREYPLNVIARTSTTVTLLRSAQTATPGQWGLFYEGDGHITIGGTPQLEGKTVTWDVIRGTPPPVDTPVSWTGIIRPTPGAAGFSAHDHAVMTPAGRCPSWFIGASPGECRPVWTIHLYGMGSTRAGVLRGVHVTSELELPAVLPTYRNSREGPRFGKGRTHLGGVEAQDIEAVLEELSVTGEERFVLIGWSMGAQMALSIAADPRWADRIDRIVLESPVLDWKRTIGHSLNHRRLPKGLGVDALKWIGNRNTAPMIGLDHALDVGALDWISRADEIQQPVLVLQGKGDNSTPYLAAAEFAKVGRNVHLVDTGGGHTTGWNINPHRWSSAMREFLIAGAF